MRGFLVLVVMLAVGCLSAVERREDRLRQRAAFDMRCDAGALSISELDRRTAGVEGCGQRGVYVWSDQGMWVLNTPGGDDSSALTSPPPSRWRPSPAARGVAPH
jgi:hypothetical protein